MAHTLFRLFASILTPQPLLSMLCRKVYYSISAAIHSRIVRVRSRKDRRNREPPRFVRGGAAGGQRGGSQRPAGQQ